MKTTSVTLLLCLIVLSATIYAESGVSVVANPPDPDELHPSSVDISVYEWGGVVRSPIGQDPAAPAIVFIINQNEDFKGVFLPNFTCKAKVDSQGFFRFKDDMKPSMFQDPPGPCTSLKVKFCPVVSDPAQLADCLDLIDKFPSSPNYGKRYSPVSLNAIPECSPAQSGTMELPPPTGVTFDHTDNSMASSSVRYCSQGSVGFSALQPLCAPLMLLFGLLMGAMFILGRSPFSFFDISTKPRFSRGGQYQMRRMTKSDLSSQIMQQAAQGLASYAMSAGMGAAEKKIAGSGKTALKNATAGQTGATDAKGAAADTAVAPKAAEKPAEGSKLTGLVNLVGKVGRMLDGGILGGPKWLKKALNGRRRRKNSPVNAKKGKPEQGKQTPPSLAGYNVMAAVKQSTELNVQTPATAKTQAAAPTPSKGFRVGSKTPGQWLKMILPYPFGSILAGDFKEVIPFLPVRDRTTGKKTRFSGGILEKAYKEFAAYPKGYFSNVSKVTGIHLDKAERELAKYEKGMKKYRNTQAEELKGIETQLKDPKLSVDATERKNLTEKAQTIRQWLNGASSAPDKKGRGLNDAIKGLRSQIQMGTQQMSAGGDYGNPLNLTRAFHLATTVAKQARAEFREGVMHQEHQLLQQLLNNQKDYNSATTDVKKKKAILDSCLAELKQGGMDIGETRLAKLFGLAKDEAAKAGAGNDAIYDNAIAGRINSLRSGASGKLPTAGSVFSDIHDIAFHSEVHRVSREGLSQMGGWQGDLKEAYRRSFGRVVDFYLLPVRAVDFTKTLLTGDERGIEHAVRSRVEINTNYVGRARGRPEDVAAFEHCQSLAQEERENYLAKHWKEVESGLNFLTRQAGTVRMGLSGELQKRYSTLTKSLAESGVNVLSTSDLTFQEREQVAAAGVETGKYVEVERAQDGRFYFVRAAPDASTGGRTLERVYLDTRKAALSGDGKHLDAVVAASQLNLQGRAAEALQDAQAIMASMETLSSLTQAAAHYSRITERRQADERFIHAGDSAAKAIPKKDRSEQQTDFLSAWEAYKKSPDNPAAAITLSASFSSYSSSLGKLDDNDPAKIALVQVYNAMNVSPTFNQALYIGGSISAGEEVASAFQKAAESAARRPHATSNAYESMLAVNNALAECEQSLSNPAVTSGTRKQVKDKLSGVVDTFMTQNSEVAGGNPVIANNVEALRASVSNFVLAPEGTATQENYLRQARNTANAVSAAFMGPAESNAAWGNAWNKYSETVANPKSTLQERQSAAQTVGELADGFRLSLVGKDNKELQSQLAQVSDNVSGYSSELSSVIRDNRVAELSARAVSYALSGYTGMVAGTADPYDSLTQAAAAKFVNDNLTELNKAEWQINQAQALDDKKAEDKARATSSYIQDKVMPYLVNSNGLEHDLSTGASMATLAKLERFDELRHAQEVATMELPPTLAKEHKEEIANFQAQVGKLADSFDSSGGHFKLPDGMVESNVDDLRDMVHTMHGLKMAIEAGALKPSDEVKAWGLAVGMLASGQVDAGGKKADAYFDSRDALDGLISQAFNENQVVRAKGGQPPSPPPPRYALKIKDEPSGI